MSAAGKKLLQTYERTNGGVNGYAVSLKKDGIELILVAAEMGQVEHAAKVAGLGEVNLDRIQSVAVLPRCSVLDDVKGD
jgi:hypothetical protein